MTIPLNQRLQATLLALFVVVERVRTTPMIDLALFRRSTYLGSTFAMLGYAFAGQVMMTLLPLYLQSAHGLSPFMAGLAMMPFAIPLVFSPRLAGPLAQQLSARIVLTLWLVVIGRGDILTAVNLACSGSYFAVALGLMVSGAGTGLLNGETTKAMISAVPPERAGMAGGLTGTTRFVGIVAGISVLGAVLAAGTEHHVAVGLNPLVLIGARPMYMRWHSAPRLKPVQARAPVDLQPTLYKPSPKQVSPRVLSGSSWWRASSRLRPLN